MSNLLHPSLQAKCRSRALKRLKYLCCFAAIVKTSAYGLPQTEGPALREIVAKHFPDGNVLIGGTTSLSKKSYTSGLLDREFSYITPENDFKHSRIHPRPGVWQWSDQDQWVKHAEKNGQLIRLHGPIGPQASRWALADDRTPEELEKSLVDFMTALCKRYDGHPNVRWMDVVNETVTPKGEWFSPKPGVDKWENPWTIMGFDESHPLRPPVYIKRAFEIANEHAPNTKLILNQHGSMEPEMWSKVIATVYYLRSHGLRVDGIGWQAHVDVGWEKEPGNVEHLEQLIDWAHASDLSFHVTENNVWLRGRRKDYEAQAETFATILRIVLSKRESGEVGWNVWNLSDADSWVDRQDLDGCIFDREYQPKPAYYALREVLQQAADE